MVLFRASDTAPLQTCLPINIVRFFVGSNYIEIVEGLPNIGGTRGY